MSPPASPTYRSDIPAEAEETVTAHHPNGARRETALHLDGALVGRRYYDEEGWLEGELPLRDGLAHGWQYRWHDGAALMHAEPWVQGQIHGTASQWDADGRLLGTYTLDHGTGLDLWWQRDDGGAVVLAEVHPLRQGRLHGRQWWFREDGTIWLEVPFREGKQHGVERSWNRQGRLKRGYPRYWRDGARITRRAYLRAAARDPEVPPVVAEENHPERRFPPEVQAALRPSPTA